MDDNNTMNPPVPSTPIPDAGQPTMPSAPDMPTQDTNEPMPPSDMPSDKPDENQGGDNQTGQ